MATGAPSQGPWRFSRPGMSQSFPPPRLISKEARMARLIVAWIVGLSLIANGLTMLAVPEAWYALVPGVPQTGPFNPHFVRDIGAAYLVAGGTLVWFAIDRAARLAALAATAFLAIHAVIHLWDAAAGRG